MSRLMERLIDLIVLGSLLLFAREMQQPAPEIAGMVVGGAVSFWMTKNATTPDPKVAEAITLAAEKAEAAAALASSTAEAAKTLATALQAKEQT